MALTARIYASRPELAMGWCAGAVYSLLAASSGRDSSYRRRLVPDAHVQRLTAGERRPRRRGRLHPREVSSALGKPSGRSPMEAARSVTRARDDLEVAVARVRLVDAERSPRGCKVRDDVGRRLRGLVPGDVRVVADVEVSLACMANDRVRSRDRPLRRTSSSPHTTEMKTGPGWLCQPLWPPGWKTMV